MATISDLSCDLVEEILSRVPITCLGAVRSTCKRWNTLSKSRLLCKAESKQQFVRFMTKNSKLCSLRFNLHKEGFSVKEISDSFGISKVLVCDGLLLCVTVTRDEKDEIIQQRLMVWNPYLGQTRWIQPARTAYHCESDIYALGYDNNRCNHKILRHSKKECEIYDFKSDSWRIYFFHHDLLL
ncbi:putative F-box protein [Raphanus sativus]|uniref:F-box protein At3g20030 n=1 Tax=Raphanus sativus TaxID=3726 RepID=A0A6J0JKT7_RAPSA|nr:putative F-box protein At3g20030 [Raphanus sativus]KAJ4891269.1 putative F-box protein [Raphanus sativus]